MVRSEKNIQVVLSSRSAGRSFVEGQMLSLRFHDYVVFELSAQSEEDLEKILVYCGRNVRH